jgi:hypothetical protein
MDMPSDKRYKTAQEVALEAGQKFADQFFFHMMNDSESQMRTRVMKCTGQVHLTDQIVLKLKASNEQTKIQLAQNLGNLVAKRKLSDLMKESEETNEPTTVNVFDLVTDVNTNTFSDTTSNDIKLRSCSKTSTVSGKCKLQFEDLPHQLVNALSVLVVKVDKFKYVNRQSKSQHSHNGWRLEYPQKKNHPYIYLGSYIDKRVAEFCQLMFLVDIDLRIQSLHSVLTYSFDTWIKIHTQKIDKMAMADYKRWTVDFLSSFRPDNKVHIVYAKLCEDGDDQKVQEVQVSTWPDVNTIHPQIQSW